MSSGAQEWRALSLLEPVPQRPREIAGGVGTAILIPLLVTIALLVSALLNKWWGTRLPPIPQDLPVMQTRFVRLGRPDSTKMASAEAAAKTVNTEKPPEPNQPEPAKQEVAPILPQATEKKKPVEKKDTRSTEEMLEELNKSAGEISQASRTTENEGDREGIAQGTVSRADADIYIGKLYEYFRRGWQVPSSISDYDLQRLVCEVEVSITEDARVGEFQISNSSGNDAFDQSVLNRLEQALGAPLPPPPKDSEERFLNQTISLRFFGKNAR